MDPEDEYGTIAPIERSPYLGAAADAATGVRQFLNRAQIPYLGGAGNLLVGEAPEELDRWAYGFHPFKDRAVPGYSGLRIPEIQEKRAGPVADALFLGADVTGLGMGTAALGKAGVRGAARQFQNAVSDAGMDASRRQFVKNAGIVGGTAAVASATPDIVKAGLRGLKKLAPEPTTVGTRVAKNALATFPEYAQKLRMLDSLTNPVISKRARRLLDDSDAYQDMLRRQGDEWGQARAKWDEEQALLAPEDRFPGEFEDYMEANGSGGYLTDTDHAIENMFIDADRAAADNWYAYRNAEEAALREANPEWAKKMDDFDNLEREWHQARTDAYAHEPGESPRSAGMVEARERKLAEVDARYKKRLKEDFGVLIDDADVMEQLKYGKENYVDPISGIEPVMKIGPNGEEYLEWSRRSILDEPKGRPQSWTHRHWVPDENIPDSDKLIEEIMKSDIFLNGPVQPGLRDIPF